MKYILKKNTYTGGRVSNGFGITVSFYLPSIVLVLGHYYNTACFENEVKDI